AHGIPFAPLDGGGDLASANGHLDHVLHGLEHNAVPCDGLPVDVDLPDPGEVNEIVNEQACEDLSAVNGYVVGATGVVTFHAGVSIALGDGFSVLTGGTFTARVDY
ncbi:MAG: hypothetical protein IH936_15585, partial [Acidobacteria bacterium]|nr:hypothetical protein [Acidobacteriota bacterium]